MAETRRRICLLATLLGVQPEGFTYTSESTGYAWREYSSQTVAEMTGPHESWFNGEGVNTALLLTDLIVCLARVR